MDVDKEDEEKKRTITGRVGISSVTLIGNEAKRSKDEERDLEELERCEKRESHRIRS